ncbi:MAG: Fur family transcriptional regulator [Christensenellales bacterium]|jgi:Fur family peroxide stress response transcriptional regulator
MTKRQTVQKRMIGDVLSQLDHPTAAEVYEEIRKAYPQISLGTVYRNLGLMADEEAVLRLSFPGAPDRFDPNTHEHFHVACDGCGRIFDTDHTIPPGLIERLDRAVEDCTGVRVTRHAIAFGGICAQCRSAGRS